MSQLVGIDLVSIEKVKRMWKDHRERFRATVLSPRERIELSEIAMSDRQMTSRQLRYLATRFAAKEAAIKALQVRHNLAFELSDIEILGAEQPKVHFRGSLGKYCQRKKIREWSCCLDSAGSLAIAMVVGLQDD